MQHWLPEKRTVTFYLMDRFCMRGLSSAMTVLRLANEAKGEHYYEWRLVSYSGEPVSSFCSIRVPAHMSLSDAREQSGRARTSVAVVCGGTSLPEECRALDIWLRERQNHGVQIATIGGASFVPARAGLFQNLRWSVHWEQFPIFTERFPELDAHQTLFEVDQGFCSCAGGDAVFDMFSGIVQKDLGPVVADRICELALQTRVRQPGEQQRVPLESRFGGVHPGIVKIIDHMSANLVDRLKLDEFEATTGLSRRQIERLFPTQLGRTPARFHAELRLERANLLIQNSPLPITDIAVACGFVSASHFTKAYRKQYNRTPRQQRAAIRSTGIFSPA
jgi:transcriptional regulator GlxA family with amidase domain